MKGKALRRALSGDDLSVARVTEALPPLQDSTELITPERAQEMLRKNKRNRPINWRKVEEYAKDMQAGLWRVHGQGIMLDDEGNILTGQKRLWAVVYSGVSVYFRISRGNPPETARWIDRGTPQTARDLATRETGRKHSPYEASIVRAALALSGITDATTDEIATKIELNDESLKHLLYETRRVKKTRAILMILGVLLAQENPRVDKVEAYAEQLEMALLPYLVQKIWGKGAAFGMAMRTAESVVSA